MKVIPTILAFFLITQLVGLYVGISLIQNAQAVPELKELTVAPTKEPGNILNAVCFMGYVLAGAASIFLVLKYYKGFLLFRLLEFFIIFVASSVVFFVILFNLMMLDLTTTLFASALLAFCFASVKFFYPAIKNISAIVSSAGVGAIFGFSVGFIPALLFALFLSVYDYIAVFKTRHMIVLARELTSRKLSFSVSAKAVPKMREGEPKKEYAERVKEETRTLDLGTGDLAIPLMLAVSAYPLGGIIPALAMVAGSSVALFVTLYLVSKHRVFIPALPPLCFGEVLAFFLIRLVGL
jgi:presenilin-like A22 family membrane protease